MNEINKKPTVTIGIPAYNEEANIGHLLKDILEQKREGFVLEKIIVASDGSTDSTVLISEENKNLPMQIFDNKERKGVAVRMNQIIGKCFSDVLIILNADILIPDQKFISRIIQPIAEKKADLVSCKVEALESRSFFGRVLKANFDFKEIFFGEYHQGKNIFTCHGVARAFSKNFYSHFRFTESVGEDAYSYLYCLWQGFSYVYVSDTSVLIKLSENFADHKKQSLRFSDSKSLFHGKFGENFIQKQYRLPIGLLFKKLPGYFFKNPVLAGVFLLQNCYLKFLHFFLKNKKTNLQTWEISASSKQLRDSNENPKERKTEMSFLLKLSRTVFLRKTIYGLLALIDKVFSRQEQVIVLCYHSIGEGDFYFSTSQAEFKKQIDLLIKKGYDSLSPTDFQSWLENGAEKLSTPKFLLTFDDGYRDVLAIKDFLREKGIKPIMFVLSDEEKVSKEELGAEKSLLSKEEILELKKNGWEIGSHGATHGDFEKMGRGELENEIAGSKKKLEEKLGFAIDYFAYPKGVYDKTILDLVASAGYKLAFSMDDGSIFFQTNRYTIPRIGINKSHSSGEFLAVFSLTVIKFRVIIKKIFYLIKSEK